MLWMTGMCPVKALSTEILWSVGQSGGKRGLEIQSICFCVIPYQSDSWVALSCPGGLSDFRAQGPAQ